MIFETERLIMRPWAENDAESLYEYARDPAVGPIAGWPPHTSIENSLEVIRNVLSEPETYAVCLKDDNRAIGSIGLMFGSATNLNLPDKEAEIGYWIGVPFWGMGLIPEAVRALIRYAFVDLKLDTLWCGYFDGNEKSKRCMEKCGFKYHHTNYDIHWKITDEIRTEHVERLKKDEWISSDYRIVKLSNRKDLKYKAAEWFSSKWRIPEEAYIDSIEDSFNAYAVPSWYLCFDGEKIIAGAGVIENDFHDRPDLSPNICAVYTEEDYRNRRIAGNILEYICEDMFKLGIDTLYLLTDHTGFYERYGWEFYCMARGEGEDKDSRMYIHLEHHSKENQ